MALLLTIPQWSLGRDRVLTSAVEDLIRGANVRFHYCRSDVDLNRTVTAFSGKPKHVVGTLFELCALYFDRIDLNRHVGAFPRIGALDVCPFVEVGGEGWCGGKEALLSVASEFGERLARTFDLPVFLYERSEGARSESELAELRLGGFGGLMGKKLSTDYGPPQVHPRLGVTYTGVRDFVIALHFTFADADSRIAKRLAGSVRRLRQEGDERFLGVRALGTYLPSRRRGLVSLNLTLPDLTPVDPIVEFLNQQTRKMYRTPSPAHLVGAIRERDLSGAAKLAIAPEQVVSEVRTEA